MNNKQLGYRIYYLFMIKQESAGAGKFEFIFHMIFHFTGFDNEILARFSHSILLYWVTHKSIFSQSQPKGDDKSQSFREKHCCKNVTQQKKMMIFFHHIVLWLKNDIRTNRMGKNLLLISPIKIKKQNVISTARKNTDIDSLNTPITHASICDNHSFR